jgi:fibronectin type 3 domain-containing protein
MKRLLVSLPFHCFFMTNFSKKKQLDIFFLVLVFLFLSLIISCAHREVDPDVRSNPYDPGNDKWTENTAPVITVSADSLWYDFNHSTATGTITLYLHEDDLNFPYDTIVGSVFYNDSEVKLPRLSLKKDTTLLLSGIKPDTAAQCTVIVYDSKQSVTSRVLRIIAPDSFPAAPPQARIINSSQQVTLTWTQVPNVNYVVYYSDSLKGPYYDSVIVNQMSSSTVSINNQPSDYFPRYYIISTTNKYGSAHSTDTLVGRRYYSGISTPSINSVSQGTLANCIVLSIYNYSYNLDYLEIYRSTNDTNAFRLIGKLNLNTNSNYVYYYDSVKTSSNYYYRICTIDKQGRCSFPSAAQYGYLQRLYAPTLYINPYPDYIYMSWTSVSGGTKYRVYRSPFNCIDSIKLLTETNLLSYTDSPPNNKIYFYTVSAVTNNGLEGSKSSCAQSKMTILPKPDSIFVTTNYYPKHVALTWRKVIGADGYIIYRGKNYNDSLPTDTISNNMHNDTLPDYLLRYYRIAAFNSKGIGLLSSAYSGSVITPIFTNYIIKNDSVFLTFATNSRATKYFIYKSSNLVDFTLIDSTTKSSYNAPIEDFNTWYYRFTIQTPEGESYPSASTRIIRQLSTPYNIKITSLIYGVRIEWSKVIGAEKYDIYRSTNVSSSSFYRTTADTFFIDTIPEGSSLYYYSLRSVNSSTTSSLSPPIPIISVSASQGTKTNMIEISWTPVSGATSYRIYRAPTDTFNRNITRIATLTTTTHTDYVITDSIYYYKISVLTSTGESGFSAQTAYGYCYPTTKPLPITYANSSGGKDYISLSWHKPPTSVGYNKYSIYRSTSSDGPFELIASTTETSYKDIPPQRFPVVYWYTIKVVNQMGESGPSGYLSCYLTQ